MRYKGLLIALIIFLLIVNTMALWEGYFGLFSFLLTLGLILFFLSLFILTLVYLIKAIIEKFGNKDRNVILLGMVITLTLTFFYPRGIISFGWDDDELFLKANQEGVANCTSKLKLHRDGRFLFKSICFGVEDTKGDYTMIGDTVFFNRDEFFKKRGMKFNLGVIKRDSTNAPQTIDMYTHKSNLMGYPLRIRIFNQEEDE